MRYHEHVPAIVEDVPGITADMPVAAILSGQKVAGPRIMPSIEEGVADSARELARDEDTQGPGGAAARRYEGELLLHQNNSSCGRVGFIDR
ncbi:hypothetical protein ABID21_001897 [Pseudorhizobium tarimense]|uniref:Uncharacterized protein n=1 Tax=Pseudorhizobium tarimense TaxID=1079109 RepID=A0ABV2H5H4_9HYPH